MTPRIRSPVEHAGRIHVKVGTRAHLLELPPPPPRAGPTREDLDGPPLPTPKPRREDPPRRGGRPPAETRGAARPARARDRRGRSGFRECEGAIGVSFPPLPLLRSSGPGGPAGAALRPRPDTPGRGPTGAASPARPARPVGRVLPTVRRGLVSSAPDRNMTRDARGNLGNGAVLAPQVSERWEVSPDKPPSRYRHKPRGFSPSVS